MWNGADMGTADGDNLALAVLWFWWLFGVGGIGVGSILVVSGGMALTRALQMSGTGRCVAPPTPPPAPVALVLAPQ